MNQLQALTPREAENNLEALMALNKHPGWALLVEHLKARAENEMSAMRNSPSQDDLLKHTYTYMALADLPNAPALLASVLQMKLQSTKK
jgi:hypothetical protein